MTKMVNHFHNSIRLAKYKWNTEKQQLLDELKRAKENNVDNRYVIFYDPNDFID